MSFYPTKIKSVGIGTATDTSGRFLRFIGNLPCQAGDTVWTDGKVIFGNTTRQGAPLMEEPPRGIPVWYQTMDEPPKEKRGYFTARGRYKNYRIAVDEATKDYPDLWIANDKQKYEHDRESHGETDRVIDIDVIDGELIRAELHIEKASDLHDLDYHWGCYRLASNTPFYSVMNPGRIAVQVAGADGVLDDFSDVRGFQERDWYGTFRAWYKKKLETVTPSYETGYFNGDWDNGHDWDDDVGPILKYCHFFLASNILDHSMADDEFIKRCEIKILKGDNTEGKVIKLAELLEEFEKTAEEEVNLLGERESVKHIKSRAIVQNFKILPDDAWEMIVDVEIWASNTFYNETEDRDHSQGINSVIIETTPFNISSTISHNRLLLKFKSDDTYEELFSWKFLYPLMLRDSSFGGYYKGSAPSPSVTPAGAWTYQTVVACVGIDADNDGEPDEELTYYTEFWRDYDSRLDATGLEYGTPINGKQEETGEFEFPVQDGYRAKITYAGVDETYLGKLYGRYTSFGRTEHPIIGAGIWHLDSVYDENGRQIFEDIFDDENNAHKLNMSIIELKNSDYLFGVHEDKKRDIEGALYQITNGEAEQLGTGLKNFRLRELKKMTKAKR